MKLVKFNDANDSIAKDEIKSTNFCINLIAKYIYPFGLTCLVLMVLLLIECKYPYFFLQDDNRDSYLPYFVHNYESLLNGELAQYNFHQFMGIPSLASGQTAALYPFTYFAVFLSDIIFGHYFAAVDIQVILHLLIGAVGFFCFMRFFGISRKAAFFGGLTWPLSSFVIYVSNSWVVVSAAAAFFPWMLFFSFRLYKAPSIKINICAIVVRLLLFYSGNVQYFIYSVVFELLTVILYVISDSKSGEKIVNTIKFSRKYIEGYIYVLILSLPLLLPMWNQMAISVHRSSKLPFREFISLSYPIGELLKDSFYPFFKLSEHRVWLYGNMFGLSYIGYLPILFLIFGIIEAIIYKQKNTIINSVRFSVFIRPALIALLWSTNWIFNIIIYVIPILNRFRFPFKLVFYLNFYLIVIAMLLFSNFIERVSWKKMAKNVLFFLLIGIQIFNLMFLYTATEFKAFGYHDDHIPLEEKLQNKLIGGRIISLGFDKWSTFQESNQAYLTAPSLGFNYATLWGLDYFAGYDVLLSPRNAEASLGLNYNAVIGSNESIPVENLRKAAVCWYIVPKNKVNEYYSRLNAFGMIEKYEDENRVVFYDVKASPMVFYKNGEKIANENYRVSSNSIELNIYNQHSETIVLNYIFNPFFQASIDGEMTELMSTDEIHFSIFVPEGKHHIIIKYMDPYLRTGFYIVIVFFTVVVFFWLTKIMRRKII